MACGGSSCPRTDGVTDPAQRQAMAAGRASPGRMHANLEAPISLSDIKRQVGRGAGPADGLPPARRLRADAAAPAPAAQGGPWPDSGHHQRQPATAQPQAGGPTLRLHQRLCLQPRCPQAARPSTLPAAAPAPLSPGGSQAGLACCSHQDGGAQPAPRQPWGQADLSPVAPPRLSGTGTALDRQAAQAPGPTRRRRGATGSDRGCAGLRPGRPRRGR